MKAAEGAGLAKQPDGVTEPDVFEAKAAGSEVFEAKAAGMTEVDEGEADGSRDSERSNDWDMVETLSRNGLAKNVPGRAPALPMPGTRAADDEAAFRSATATGGPATRHATDDAPLLLSSGL
ncbi:MAG: hypothetical protein QM766_10650 [Burkholderiaceae bacterium]